MNRKEINSFLKEFLVEDGNIGEDKKIKFPNQIIQVNKSMYKNPVSMIGNNEDSSIATSEKIAYLINHYSTGSDVETRYAIVIKNMQLPPLLRIVPRENETYKNLVENIKRKVQNESTTENCE